jgi:hypothetical protein
MGNDSVVIMTTSQGRKINELFEKNDKDLVKLKDSIGTLVTKYTYSNKVIDSLRVIKDTISSRKDSLYALYIDMKWRRDTNLVIYQAKEKKFNKTIKLWQFLNLGYMVVMFTTVFLIKTGH